MNNALFLEGHSAVGHNLGIGTVKDLRKSLEDPVAIMKSNTQDNSFVVFINKVDENGSPVMTAIHLDKNGNVGVENEVASAYGRKNFDEFIKKQRKAGNVLYENKEISLDNLPHAGLQLPGEGDVRNPMNTIYENTANVNTQSSTTKIVKNNMLNNALFLEGHSAYREKVEHKLTDYMRRRAAK